jgi:hypothetical protein
MLGEEDLKGLQHVPDKSYPSSPYNTGGKPRQKIQAWTAITMGISSV